MLHRRGSHGDHCVQRKRRIPDLLHQIQWQWVTLTLIVRMWNWFYVDHIVKVVPLVYLNCPAEIKTWKIWPPRFQTLDILTVLQEGQSTRHDFHGNFEMTLGLKSLDSVPFFVWSIHLIIQSMLSWFSILSCVNVMKLKRLFLVKICNKVRL